MAETEKMKDSQMEKYAHKIHHLWKYAFVLTQDPETYKLSYHKDNL